MTRNKRDLWYALYEGKAPVVNAEGYETGAYRAVYGPVIHLRGNVSAAKGEAQVEPFGVDVSYDRALVLDDPKTPIDEHAVLWIDAAPEIDADGRATTAYDHVVKRVARSINSVTIALARVDVRV